MVERVEIRKVTARKQHYCQECGSAIEKGTPYIDDVLKMDDVYHWRMHVDCMECREAVDREHCAILRGQDYNPPLYEIDEFTSKLEDWEKDFPHVVARFRDE